MAPNDTKLGSYGVGYMVKDHLDSKRGNPLPPLHGLLFAINSEGSFIYTISQTTTTVFVTQITEHWLERDIAQLVPPCGIDPTTNRTMSGRSTVKLHLLPILNEIKTRNFYINTS